MVWCECSADEGADLDDRQQWRKANASCPHRTPESSIARMRKKLDPDGFRREGLGLWPLQEEAAFSMSSWVKLEYRGDDDPYRVVLVADVSPDGKSGCIAAAGEVDGKPLVLVYPMAGPAGMADKMLELVDAGVVDEVYITPGQARALEPDLVRLGVEYKRLTGTDMAAAYAALRDAVKQGSVAHRGQPELDAAIANVKTRRLSSGETEVVDRREIKADVSPAVAASAAFYQFGLLEAPIPAIY